MNADHPASPLAEAILALLTDKYDVPPGTPGTERFEELDIDSLVLAEIAVDLSARTGIRVEEHDLSSAGSADEAAKSLHAKGARI